MNSKVTIEKLRNLLSCTTYNGTQHTSIVIKEKDRLAKLKQVTLSLLNGDWFSFNPDNGRGKSAIMSPLLVTGREYDHHRACDCVVVINNDGKLTIVYIDLKSDNPTSYASQFKSVRQFMRYVLGLLEEFHGEKFKIYKERYIILYTGKKASINKSRTVPKPSVSDSQPNNPCKRITHDRETIHFKELLSDCRQLTTTI